VGRNGYDWADGSPPPTKRGVLTRMRGTLRTSLGHSDSRTLEALGALGALS